MDLLMIEQGDGGEFAFVGGDIASDNGLYTCVYLSLFSGSCWASLFSEDVATDRAFYVALNSVITKESLKVMESEAQLALEWLKSDGVAQDISVEATNPDRDTIQIIINITEPDGSNNEFKLLWDKERKSVARFINVENGGYGI